jgi:hypothetical protein
VQLLKRELYIRRKPRNLPVLCDFFGLRHQLPLNRRKEEVAQGISQGDFLGISQGDF